MSKRYYATRVEFLRDVECKTGTHLKTTMAQGWILGNVNGWRDGVTVVEKDDGTVYIHIAVDGGESYEGIPLDAVKITPEEDRG